MLHAKLSASGSQRWLNCPPSVRLEEQFPDSTSTYAEEGTFMHALAEKQLNQWLGMPVEGKLEESPFFTPEIYEAVCEYTSFVTEKICEIKDGVTVIEKRVDFSRWVPEGFGTADALLVSEGVLEVIDLKGGAGIPVSAVGNSQMRLYALGALDAYDCLFDITTIRMTIVQPRCGGVSTDEMSVEELLEWAETVVRPAAKQAFAGEGEFKAGPHCTWCKAKAVCRERAESNLELLRFELSDPPLLTLEEIADILPKTDALKRWAKDVEEYALKEALKGTEFPGFKLVEGRSVRQYVDEDAVAMVLKGHADVYKPRELLGITAMEKLLGKARFKELLQDLVVKPQGKPSLVPIEDKRLAFDFD